MTDDSQAIQTVNPATGEVLEHLDQQPPEALAEALDAVRARQAELKRWEGPLVDEWRRRLNLLGRKRVTFGDWEIEAQTSRESVWDADQLEAAMDNLVRSGTVRAGDLVGIITRDPVVARSKAKQLAQRLTGDARASVEACCEWREKPGKLTVTRSVQLLDAAPSTTEEQSSTTYLDPGELFA